MRKIIIVILMLLFSGTAIAFDPGNSAQNSGLKTASELLYTGAGYLYGVTVATDGTNAAQIDLFDYTSVSEGTQLIPTFVVTTSATDRTQTLQFDTPIQFNTGLYLRVICSGTASANVYYRKQ